MKLPVGWKYENLVENITFRVDADEQSGLREKIIIESKDRTKVPEVNVVDKNGQIVKTYALPVVHTLCLRTVKRLRPARYS